MVLAMVLSLILCSSAVASKLPFSRANGPVRILERGAVAEMNAAAPRSARPSSRGAAEASPSPEPRRHLRGGSEDRRVLHTDDFAETVVDNQWLVLLGILLLMGSGSAWNYCLLLTCCETCEGRAPSLWEALICLVCCRPRRERHNYRHGRDPYYDDDGCCCGGRRRRGRVVYVEPIYPTYGAPGYVV